MKKKVVRLTESDLVNIIKRVIKEEEHFISQRSGNWMKNDRRNYLRPSDDFDDEEEFDDFDKYNERFPTDIKDNPFRMNMGINDPDEIYNDAKRGFDSFGPHRIRTRKKRGEGFEIYYGVFKNMENLLSRGKETPEQIEDHIEMANEILDSISRDKNLTNDEVKGLNKIGSDLLRRLTYLQNKK